MASKSEADLKFMRLAEDISSESDDPEYPNRAEAGVGCVIVVNNEVVVGAANRLPPKLREANFLEKKEIGEKYFFVEHAERTAILQAMSNGINLNGGTLYCTRFPCSDCARAILFADIKRVVVSSGISSEGHWQKSQRAALEMLRKSGVVVRYL